MQALPFSVSSDPSLDARAEHATIAGELVATVLEGRRMSRHCLNGPLVIAWGLALLFALAESADGQPPTGRRQPVLLETTAAHKEDVRAVVYLPDGKTVATGSEDGTIKLWDAETQKESRVLQGHKKAVRALACYPDGKTLASATPARTRRLWD